MFGQPRLPLRTVSALLLAAASLLTVPIAVAQEYPSRPIRLIFGYPPGGSGDPMLRVLSVKVHGSLGQPVLVENRTGAGTNIASEFVATSSPDGYTLLVGGDASHGINPVLYKKLNFDPQKDFIPITKLVRQPMILAVHPSLGVNTLREFMSMAKANPGKIHYASSGSGTATHMAGVMFNAVAGVELVHVPYRGGGPAATAVLGGEPKVVFGSATQILPHLPTGKLKALSTMGPKGDPVIPGIPGAGEAGVTGVNISSYLGLWAPAKTPEAVVQKLFAAFTAALRDPDVQVQLTKMGQIAEPSASPAAFDAFVKSDSTVWAKLVKASNAKVD